MDKNTKNTRTLSISPNPKNNSKATRRGEKGRNLHPWQKGAVGSDPTGRNARRVAEGGDPARSSGGVLERERERETAWGLGDEWIWGSWSSPCPLITPTRSNMCGSIAVIAVVPPGRKYHTQSGSTALPAAVKNYCRAGCGSTVFDLAVVP